MRALSHGRADDAIKMIDRSRPRAVFGAWAEPLLAEAYRATGIQKANAGRWQEALNALEIALKYRPGDATVRDYVVRVSQRRADQLLREGKKPQADAVLRKATQLVPGDERLLRGPAQPDRRSGEKPRKGHKGKHKR